ncbi:MAG: N-6 DNA methylase [Rhodococcus sp.]|nr:N-6 DNA methylase [Rhodococcus sp. (in: high G+C Gram-positive bacteria)]
MRVEQDAAVGGSAAKVVEALVKSKQRVADHGEVFTPEWLVNDMLDLVRDETERIDARFLEPACGSGNFLVQVLARKLAAVERRYSKSEFDKRHQALHGLMCIYGIELLEDNIAECRANMLEIFAAYLGLSTDSDFCRAAGRVLEVNIVHADALTMRTPGGRPIVFAEWAYRGRGRFQRRDFRFESMTQRAAFSVSSGAADSLFAGAAKHEIFSPMREFKPMTVKEIAEMER